MKVLVQSGADVNAVNRDKETALHVAANNGHVDVVKVLVQNGVDVNAVNKDKETPLYAAFFMNQLACSLQLICCGAKIDKMTIDEEKK